MNDYSDLINELENLDLSGAFVGLGILLFIFGLMFLAFAIIIYILQSIALYKLAVKNNVNNAWLAWIPIGNMYLLGKMGFEVYAPADKKNEVFTWVLLGCSAASFLFDNGLSSIANIGVLVFSTWAYYYIFNKINNKNSVLFTVLAAIFRIGGIILFFNRKRFTNESETVVKEAVKEEKKEEPVDKPKFCSYCGNKVNKTSKFCSKCGSKL